MVNRNGFIRVIELLIAITLISIILLITYLRIIPTQQTQDLSEVARDILTEASTIESIRTEVINAQTNVNQMTGMMNFINASLPDYINFELRACDVSSACGRSTYEGDVYSAERIISTDNNRFDPVKLRLFLWVG